jgi:hypothetical protein
MKVQVRCRSGGDPARSSSVCSGCTSCVFFERAAEDSQRRFRVRVVDGREFVLRRDLETGSWRLARVHGRRR